MVLVVLAALVPVSNCSARDYDQQRMQMRDDIERSARQAARLGGTPLIAEATLGVMTKVPRHEFVPDDWLAAAYENRPLPIGHGQTISQPYIVALMTDLADVGKESVVLEVGTGSGYQAAVLAELAGRVYTIEIVPQLGRQAANVLARLGYDNVEVRIGDGYAGWPEHAPFDAIVVTAAPETVPQPLIEQLRPGGRLVIPVGGSGAQDLQVLTKNADGDVTVKSIIPVAFVPFTREHR